jgi:SAM-dependent methyltransferase
MEHVDNSDSMMSECNRILKPGGILILSVPLCWELHEEPYDFFRFTKYGLKELCDRNNFEVMELIPNGGKWSAITQMNINMVYSTFKRKNLFIKGMKFLFINLHFTELLNRLAIKVDDRFFDPLLTLNYVLVARKKNATT